MTEVELLAASLVKAFKEKKDQVALKVVENMRHYFEEDPSVSEIDAAILCLFAPDTEEYALPHLLQMYCPNTQFKAVVRGMFELLELLLANFQNKLHAYIDDIMQVCLSTLSGGHDHSVKLSCLSSLFVVVRGSWPEAASALTDHMVASLRAPGDPPTVRGKHLELIGHLWKYYPELLSPHENLIAAHFMSVIASQAHGQAKLEPKLLEGALLGMVGHMERCNTDELSSAAYSAVRRFADPGEQTKKECARAALKMIAVHGHSFSMQLHQELRYWHSLLTRWLTTYSGGKDKQLACESVEAFYRAVGDVMAGKGPSEETDEALKYLMEYFRSCLSVRTSALDTYEEKMSLKGLALILDKCRGTLTHQEFTCMTSMLTQRAMLEYREGESSDKEEDAEKLTQKIEKVCMYVEAISRIGTSSDRSLETLVRILVTEYPNCRQHRRYIIEKAVAGTLPQMDLKNFTAFFIRESCRHYMSSSLHYVPPLLQTGSAVHRLRTYEEYVPLWNALLPSGSPLTKRLFDYFLEAILELLPTLDLAASTMLDTDVANLPSSPSDYRLLVNACALCACLLLLHRPPAPPLPLLRASTCPGAGEGARGALLQLAEAALQCGHYEEYDEECNSVVLELLKSLSIVDVSGLLQLRSALVMLHAPPKLLDRGLLQTAAEAFEVILREGKTNPPLATLAVNTIDKWDYCIDRELFRPLCKQVLPLLNDYLCSSGIHDTSTLSTSKTYTTSSKKSTAKKNTLSVATTPQLATLQHQIMLFIGKMDSETMECLLTRPSSSNKGVSLEEETEKRLTDMTDRLKLSLPCPQQHKLELYLDALIPRLRSLSLTSSCRDTRLTACQGLHSIIIMVYGTSVLLPPSLQGCLSPHISGLTSAMLSLAQDPDPSVSAMFAPLLRQSCHWMATPRHANSTEGEHFTRALIEGACHPWDCAIRDTACGAIKELMVWSERQRQTVTGGASTTRGLLRVLARMTLHPDGYRKRGAFLILNKWLPQLLNLEHAIDKHLPELLYCTINSLHAADQNIHREEAVKTLKVLLKCLELKAHLFKKSSNTRRIPPNMGDAILEDICHFLMRQVRESNCRTVAKRIFNTLVNVILKIGKFKTQKMFYDSIPKEKGFDSFVSEYFEGNDLKLNAENYDSLILSLQNLFNSLDTYVLTIENELIDVQTFFGEQTSEVSIFNSVLDFLCMVSDESTLQMNWTQKENYNKLCFEITWKCCRFLMNIGSRKSSLLNDFIDDNFFKVLIAWLMDYKKISVLKHNLDADVDAWSVDKVLDELKTCLNDKNWSKFQEVLSKSLENHEINKLFSDFNLDAINNMKHVVSSLQNIEIILKKVDSKGFHGIVKKWNLEVAKEAILNMLFENDISDEISTAILDPSIEDAMGKILKFILNSNEIEFVQICQDVTNGSKVLPAILEVRNANVGMVAVGGHFVRTFKCQIVPHLIANFKTLVTYIFENVSEKNKDAYIELIEEILQFSTGKKNYPPSFPKEISELVIKIWPQLVAWSTDIDKLLELYTLLAIFIPDPIQLLGCRDCSLALWLMDGLQNKDNRLQDKARFITLLPTIVQPGTEEGWNSDLLTKALDGIRAHFPLLSSELPPHSSERAVYLSCLQSLLEAMANSGSFPVMDCVIQAVAADQNHMCKSQISHKMAATCRRLNTAQQLATLNKVFDIYLSDRSIDPQVRINILNNFFQTLIKNSSVNAVEAFYIDKLPQIVEGMLNKSVETTKAEAWALQCLCTQWIMAYTLIQNMFTKLPIAMLDASDSKIAIALFGKPPTANQFIKKFFTASYAARDIQLPVGDFGKQTQELFRLFMCCAYRCLHSITIARPKEDVKLFLCLLDTSMGRQHRLWEGLLDLTRVYSFSMMAEDSTANIQHRVPMKSKGNLPANVLYGETFKALTLSTMAPLLGSSSCISHQDIFKQTLSEDILKYDLNTAIIRDSNPRNLPMEEVTTRDGAPISCLSLEDSAVNSHECMSVVCATVADLHSISEVTEEAPRWVTCITEVMADGTRHRNVRLFLAQVVENMRLIFSNYARHMFQPVLCVIEDRCTSANGDINYLDTCLLAMLLSWSDKCIPSSASEIKSASIILRTLIEQTNPNTQTSEMFKHCLELGNVIMSIWGQKLIIPQDLILMKIQGETGLKRAGLQIAAATLSHQIPLWSDEDSFVNFKNAIWSCLKVNIKYIYNTATEIIGMMLNMIGNNSFDENCDSDRLQTCLDQTRKFLTKLYAKNRDKFVFCVYYVQKHYKTICDATMVSQVTFLIPKFPKDMKNTCLKVFLDAVDVLVDLGEDVIRQELNSLNVKELICDRDVRVLSLHILNKCLQYFSRDYVNSMLMELCTLVYVKNKDIRSVVYEILMKVYEGQTEGILNPKGVPHISMNESGFSDLSSIAGPSYSETGKKRPLESTKTDEELLEATMEMDQPTSKMDLEVRLALLHGLDDDDEELRDSVFEFWSEKMSFDMERRWLSCVCHVLLGNQESGTMSRISRLVLAACSKAPDYASSKLFDQPLEDCAFIPQRIDMSRRSQTSSTAPLFSETLNACLLVETLAYGGKDSLLKATQGLIAAPTAAFPDEITKQIRATMESINLPQSVASQSSMWNSSKRKASESFSISAESSLLFTTEPELYHRRTYRPINKQDAHEGPTELAESIERKLRRKFITNRKWQAIKFSGIAANKKEYELKQRTAEKPVQVLRNFRDGDFPDVQIPLEDILRPLLGLATRDAKFAKDLFVVIFNSLVNHMNQKESTSPKKQSKTAMSRIRSNLKMGAGNDSKMATINDFKMADTEDFKMAAFHRILSRLKAGGAGTEEICGLLQVLRLCPAVCFKDGSSAGVVTAAAKNVGVDWLGKLVLEEVEMALEDEGGEPTAKRPKLGLSSAVGLQVPPPYSGQIRQLSSKSRWKMVQELYAQAAVDDELTEEEKKYCTEQYYHCFAKLSNWDELTTQIGYQLSPELEEDATMSSVCQMVDYAAIWGQGMVLLMLLQAYTQRATQLAPNVGYPRLEQARRETLKAELQNFDGYILKWMSDNDKKCSLMSDPLLCGAVSCWRAALGPAERATPLTDLALTTLRAAWASHNVSALHTLQMVSEARNFLENPLITRVHDDFDSTASKLSQTLGSWRQCWPRPHDDTVLWDVRLACRSFYTTQLQRALTRRLKEEEVDEESQSQYTSWSSKLTLLQRQCELALCRTAAHNNNEELVFKLVKKHEPYIKEEEQLSWGLQCARGLIIKAKHQETPAQQFSHMLKAWDMAENVRSSSRSASDPVSYSGILQETSYMADFCRQLLADGVGCDQQAVNQLVSHISTDGAVPNSKAEIIAGLVEHGCHRLQEALTLIEDSQSEGLNTSQLTQMAEAHLSLAKYCRKAKNNNPELCGDLGLVRLLVRGVLRAMQLGSQEACGLFPVLVLDLTQLSKEDPTMQVFMDEVKGVPCASLVAWSAQLLVHLPLLPTVLGGVCLRMAEQAAPALQHHYRRAKLDWAPAHVHSMTPIINRLDALLLSDPETETIVRALDSLCVPTTLLKMQLWNLYKPEDKSSWDTAIYNLYKEVYPEPVVVNGSALRGKIFIDQLEQFQPMIDKITTFIPDRQSRLQSILDINRKLDVLDSKSLLGGRPLADYSPYLSALGTQSQGQTKMFGKGTTGKDDVFIARFENQVVIMDSERRPFRVTILGSDGKRYDYLVKRGEDLRQDHRLQQLLGLMGQQLSTTQDMHINTYQVIPLSKDLGLIEWVRGCATLKELAYGQAKNKDYMVMAQREREGYLNSVEGADKGSRYGNMACRAQQTEAAFQHCLQHMPKYVLRDAFLQLSVSPDKFVTMRSNYARSLSSLSIAHWLLGIGDRHLSNCLVHLATGRLVGIDFGRAFDMATLVLEVPELVPFRLTPQLVNVLAPHGTKGCLRELMLSALQTFSLQSCLLLALLEVVTREPALDWLHHNTATSHNLSLEEERTQPRGERCEHWAPTAAIRQMSLKLSGASPAACLIHNLSQRSSTEPYNQHYVNIVKHAAPDHKQDILTQQEQVDELICLATNLRILSVAWSGWVPWF